MSLSWHSALSLLSSSLNSTITDNHPPKTHAAVHPNSQNETPEQAEVSWHILAKCLRIALAFLHRHGKIEPLLLFADDVSSVQLAPFSLSLWKAPRVATTSMKGEERLGFVDHKPPSSLPHLCVHL